MKTIKILVVAMLLGVLSGCAFTNSFTRNGRMINQSNSSFKNGNYVESITTLVEILKRNKNYEKAITEMNKKLPVVQDYYNKNIEKHSIESESIYELKKLGKLYSELFFINKAIQSLDDNILMVINYNFVDLEEIRNSGAEAYYRAGVISSGNSSLKEKKETAKLFEKVLVLDLNYKDAAAKYKEYKEAAMQKLMIKEIVDGKYYGINVGKKLYDEVVSNISKDSEAMKYTTLIDRRNLELQMEELKFQRSGLVEKDEGIKVGKIIGANLILVIDVAYVDYLRPEINSNKELKVEKVNYGTKEEPNIIEEEYFEYSYEKKTEAKIEASYYILNVKSGEIVLKGNSSGDSVNVVNWKKYSNQKFGKDEIEKECISKNAIVSRAITDVSYKISNVVGDYLK